LWAANHYIRDGASGDGATWSSAWDSLPSTLTRGDTYYIADGSYPGYSFDDSESGSTFITIKKATASDHGTETGWKSSYGDGAAVFTSGLSWSTGYYVIDGQTGGGPGSWKSGYGFEHHSSSSGSDIFIDYNVTNVTFKHFKLEGDGASYSGSDIIFIRRTAQDITFSYIYAYNAGRGIIFHRGDGTDSDGPVTFEYLYAGTHGVYGQGEHSEMASLGNPNGYEASNMTFSYCVFTCGASTGGLMYNGYNLTVHGSVFVNDGSCSWGGNGALATWSWGEIDNLKAYNNSFINVSRPIGEGGSGTLTGDFKNNIFYSTTDMTLTIDQLSHSYNHYVDTVALSETGQTTGSGDPFANYSNLNFSLKNATKQGTTLKSNYNKDLAGNIRGADGIWDKGAVEFTNNAQLQIPSAPINLRVIN